MAAMQIVMDDGDFTHLITNAMKWAGEDWEPQIRRGRFLVDSQMDVWPGTHWKWAYWVGTGYAAVILARAYLDSQKASYQIASDETDGEWLILTDYEWGHAW